MGVDAQGQDGNLSDLWRYDPTRRLWTWIGGSSRAQPLGIPLLSSSNTVPDQPQAREYSSTWTDAAGRLWLFGGQVLGKKRYYDVDDLWNYNPGNGRWTRVRGSNTFDAVGNYGTQGEAATENHPGARNQAVSWTDAKGRLWLFGGTGSDVHGDISVLNDLWRYDPDTEQWTWVDGADHVGVTASYGEWSTPSPNNHPGARTESLGWVDNNGALWLFGGIGVDSKLQTRALGDLWRYQR